MKYQVELSIVGACGGYSKIPAKHAPAVGNSVLNSPINNLGSGSIRGQRVILDQDLARLYGTSTKRLNEQVKRNRERFPEDFMFQLEVQEVASLRSQFATSNAPKGGRRYRPYVFTEHGELKRRLQDIEKRLAQGFAQHEQELQEIRFLLAQLEKPIEQKKTRIGF